MSTAKTELTEEQKQMLEENPPQWKVSMIATMQANNDREYQDAVNRFKSASEGWLINAGISVANGAHVPPFTIPIPAREVIYPQRQNPGMFSVFETDPSIQIPIAPPPINNPNKGNQLSTQAGININIQNAMLTQILNDLEFIKHKLGA